MQISKVCTYLTVTLFVTLFILLILMNNTLFNVTTQMLVETMEHIKSDDVLRERVVTGKHYNDVSEQNITLQYGNCTGVLFPIQLVKTDTWHPFDEASSMYFFNAYMIRSKKRIFIIGARLRSLKVSGFCQMWKWEKDNDSLLMEVSNAYSTMSPEGPVVIKYSSTIIECPLNSNFIPTHVSLTTTACATPLNLMIVHDVITPEVYNHTFTVCLSPIFNEFSEASKLVEWFELNRILGADEFVVYNYSIAFNVDHVLRYYVKRRLVKIIQWQPPMKSQSEIHYNAQTVALNDCLFRSKSSSEFIVNIDMDEYIIPHAENVTDWSKLLQTLKAPKAITYMFLSAFFVEDSNNRTIDVAERELVEKFKLITLQKGAHELRIFRPNERSKYIVRTSGADCILIHEVPKVPKVVASVELALVHHYRSWGKDYKRKPALRDNTVKEKFGKELIRNVRNVWKDL